MTTSILTYVTDQQFVMSIVSSTYIAWLIFIIFVFMSLFLLNRNLFAIGTNPCKLFSAIRAFRAELGALHDALQAEEVRTLESSSGSWRFFETDCTNLFLNNSFVYGANFQQLLLKLIRESWGRLFEVDDLDEIVLLFDRHIIQYGYEFV